MLRALARRRQVGRLSGTTRAPARPGAQGLDSAGRSLHSQSTDASQPSSSVPPAPIASQGPTRSQGISNEILAPVPTTSVILRPPAASRAIALGRAVVSVSRHLPLRVSYLLTPPALASRYSVSATLPLRQCAWLFRAIARAIAQSRSHGAKSFLWSSRTASSGVSVLPRSHHPPSTACRGPWPCPPGTLRRTAPQSTRPTIICVRSGGGAKSGRESRSEGVNQGKYIPQGQRLTPLWLSIFISSITLVCIIQKIVYLCVEFIRI